MFKTIKTEINPQKFSKAQLTNNLQIQYIYRITIGTLALHNNNCMCVFLNNSNNNNTTTKGESNNQHETETIKNQKGNIRRTM